MFCRPDQRLSEILRRLDLNRNPFFKHAYLHPLVAYRESQPVGGLVAFMDDKVSRRMKEPIMGLGYIRGIEDEGVFQGLVEHALKWGKSRGAQKVIGPLNLNVFDAVGLQVSGFDQPAFAYTDSHPPMLESFFENQGFCKNTDLYSYSFLAADGLSERWLARMEKLRHKTGVRFRTVDWEKLDEEMNRLYPVYREALLSSSLDFPFSLPSREEFVFQFKQWKDLMSPNLIKIAEVGHEVIGFSFAIFDREPIQNSFLSKCNQFLDRTLKTSFRRASSSRIRIMTTCIKKDFQKMGIGSLIFTEYLKTREQIGYTQAEVSYVFEKDVASIQILESIGAQRTKTYRFYEKSIV